MPTKTDLEKIRQAFLGWEFSWKGLLDNRRGEWWLFGQILLVLAHLIKPWPTYDTLNDPWHVIGWVSGGGLLALGVVLASKSLINLGASLSPLPDPKHNNKLITTGAYSRCRHPLYQAMLICSLGVAVLLGSLIHCFLLYLLIWLLKGKAKREERMLKEMFPEYRNYISETPAIYEGISWLDWRN